MPSEIIYTFDAGEDIASAYAWYENQQAGLGEAFLKRIHACATAVCSSPLAFAKEQKDYRRARIKKFPYSLVYRYEQDTVLVVSVLHSARDPKLLKSRLK